VGTALGAVSAHALANPKSFGLDAAAPSAFLALVAPSLRGRDPWIVALVAAAVATVVVPYVAPGVPTLLAAAVAVVVGLSVSPGTQKLVDP
jgi:predicted branched-subunit amino acid permease